MAPDMIGVFDSGIGGLTVLGALRRRFPSVRFIYLGDHANVPYGNRGSQEIVELTRIGVERLFGAGAGLVLLGCNTATAIAARALQRNWLPYSRWQGRNVLGIVAPTVEAATQTPWAVDTPQYPQKYNADVIAVFGTLRTISSGVYREEIRKRCPMVRVVEQTAAELAGAIEERAAEARLDALVSEAVAGALAQTNGVAPHRAILGCTHFPIVEHLFRLHLPASTRLLSQPEIVANSLEDYLSRHTRYVPADETGGLTLLTTGNPTEISARASVFWPEAPLFERAD